MSPAGVIANHSPVSCDHGIYCSDLPEPGDLHGEERRLGIGEGSKYELSVLVLHWRQWKDVSLFSVIERNSAV